MGVKNFLANMMIYYIFIALVTVYVLNNFKNLLFSFSFLKKRQKNLLNKTEDKLVILMPVLREQEIIESNLEIFSNLAGDYELVYITTEREVYEKKQRFEKLKAHKDKLLATKNKDKFVELLVGLFPYSKAESFFEIRDQVEDDDQFWSRVIQEYFDTPSTADMIADYLNKNNLTNKNISQIHYPDPDGVMAHQLNFACKQLEKTHDPKKTYVICYNADSVINRDALNVFYDKISRGEKVIMQSSLFFDNYNDFDLSYRGCILRCIALAQSRWTLIHEMSRIRAQYCQGLRSVYESAHVVGHGTCVRLDTLFSVGGFPEIFTNEDLPLGYFLALSGERICPVALLENSQSPTTIASVITQYTTWFYGAMDYFKYYRYATNFLHASKIKALFWAIVNSIRAAMWLLATWVWIGLLLFGILMGAWTAVLFIVVLFFFHTALIYVLISRFVTKNPFILGEEKYNIKFNFAMLFAVPVAYFVWGIGPIRSFSQVVIAKIKNKKVYKSKTER